MKIVLDSAVALKWYLFDADMAKALRLRIDFHRGLHELLAPDHFPVECGETLVRAERTRVIGSGEADRHLTDLAAVNIKLHSSWPILGRATAIALTARLTIADSLYVALAEREGCTLVTGAHRILHRLRKLFPFVVYMATLP